MYAEKPLRFFLDKLCSDSPEPGGGSASALAGAIAASLSGMLAALTVNKNGESGLVEYLNWTAAGIEYRP